MEEAKVKAQTDKQNIMKTEIEEASENYLMITTHGERAIYDSFIAGADQFKPKWISSSERLPKLNSPVLTLVSPTIIDGNYQMVQILKDSSYGPYWSETANSDVTHWMELPKAPTT